MITSQHAIVPDSVELALREVFAAPQYEWHHPRTVLDVIAEWWQRVMDLMLELQIAHPAAFYAVVGLLTGVLLVMLAHFAYVLWRALAPKVRAHRVEVTAPQRPRDRRWYLREADRLVDEGRYGEALWSRFCALLLALDHWRVLRFHPSKTPGEYLSELRLDGPEHGAFKRIVLTLYDHLFGGTPCARDDLRHFDELATGLENHVAAQ